MAAQGLAVVAFVYEALQLDMDRPRSDLNCDFYGLRPIAACLDHPNLRWFSIASPPFIASECMVYPTIRMFAVAGIDIRSAGAISVLGKYRNSRT